MTEQQEHRVQLGVIVGLIGLGVVARLVPHPPNVTPLTALALFGGAYLSKRWSIALPLLILLFGDLFIGLHSVIAFTWSSFALVGLIGWWVRRQPRAARLVPAALLGSTVFFLLSNFGVWLMGHGALYPQTLQGLGACYVAALPFYRNALFGDLVYTFSIFGLYAGATKALLRTTTAH